MSKIVFNPLINERSGKMLQLVQRKIPKASLKHGAARNSEMNLQIDANLACAKALTHQARLACICTDGTSSSSVL